MAEAHINKFAYIDATRGLAVLGVVLVHSSFSVGATSQWLVRLMQEGATGVQLFYIASALTLCMSWHARSFAEEHPVRNYFIRRVFRIAPMFWLAVAFHPMVNGLGPTNMAPNGIEWWFLPITALFLHGWHPETINSVVPGGWSIAVEMTFYVILPLILIHFNSTKEIVIIFIISLLLYGINRYLAPIIFQYPTYEAKLVDYFSTLNFFAQMPVFATGILLYRSLHLESNRKTVHIIVASSAIPLGLLFIFPHWRIPHHIVAGGLFAAFVFFLAYFPIKIFVNSITIALGKLSFCIYLIHFVIIKVFKSLGFSELFPISNAGSLSHFAAIALTSALVSIPFHKFVEKPSISLGSRIIRRLESASNREVPVSTLRQT